MTEHNWVEVSKPAECIIWHKCNNCGLYRSVTIIGNHTFYDYIEIKSIDHEYDMREMEYIECDKFLIRNILL